MANILDEGAKMLTSSLVWGGRMTFDQLNELDWLKTTSYYGIYLFVQEAERRKWIGAIDKEGKPTVYYATSKGRKMLSERE